MNITRHKGETLQYISLTPTDYDCTKAYPIMILLHGYGSNMHDMANLAQSISRDGFIFICPNAPISMPIGLGISGFCWAPITEDSNQNDISTAEIALNGLIAEVLEKHRPKSKQMFLTGFSQGGMMAYQIGLTNPEVFSGILSLSSYIVDPESLASRLPKNRDQNIFISHGAYDPMIMIEKARETVKFLEAHGYKPSYNEYSMSHEVTHQVVKDIIEWISYVNEDSGNI